MQRTLKGPVRLEGVGLHSGAPARIVIRPASADHGIWFKRTDVLDAEPLIPALWDRVVPAQLCTRIANEDGVDVSTIEHVMAALVGCGVHNALVEVDGPEVPILDGSAVPFVRHILARGVMVQNAPLHALRIVEPVEVRRGEALARFEPAAGFELDFEIEFPDSAIGRQRLELRLDNGTFVRELSDSRTFCRQADVEAMRARGLARGGSYRNAVVVDGGRVLSPGGLRREDEPVRHKMLDALGDIALAGAPLIGRYVGRRAGHALTNALLRATFARPEAYRIEPCDAAVAARLPGVGLHLEEVPLSA